jgi:hypothetical protein
MLWATSFGAEVIAPMAVPVLGGLLMTDEVADTFLPVSFSLVRRAPAEIVRLPADSISASVESRPASTSMPVVAGPE